MLKNAIPCLLFSNLLLSSPLRENYSEILMGEKGSWDTSFERTCLICISEVWHHYSHSQKNKLKIYFYFSANFFYFLCYIEMFQIKKYLCVKKAYIHFYNGGPENQFSLVHFAVCFSNHKCRGHIS